MSCDTLHDTNSWDPEFKQIWDSSPLPPFTANNTDWIKTARESLSATVKESIYARLDFTGVTRSSIDIPMRDGSSMSALMFAPSERTMRSPLCILLHGGGWAMGEAELEAATAVELVHDHGAVAISLNYRLAPEHPFPAPVNDCWDALQWCAANAASLGADLEHGFLLGGSSAGGNLAAALQHLARDEKLDPPLTGVSLSYPVTVSPAAVPEHLRDDYKSMDENAEAPICSKAAMDLAWATYQADEMSPLASPLNWSSHAALPRTHIQVCGLDPLRDDGVLYEGELRRAGVETRFHVYPGCPHGFEAMFPDIAAGKKYVSDRRSGYQWLLRKT